MEGACAASFYGLPGWSMLLSALYLSRCGAARLEVGL